MPLKSITLRNYRSIPAAGVTIPLNHNFLGLIGVNNSGKTAILRSFYELRPIFNGLSGYRTANSGIPSLFSEQGLGQFFPALFPGERIVPDHDSTLMPRVSIEFQPDPQVVEQIVWLDIVLVDQAGLVRAEVRLKDGRQHGSLRDVKTARLDDGTSLLQGVSSNGTVVAFNWERAREELTTLSRTLYIGPFRNVVNSGGANYYDINIGKDFIAQFDQFKTGPDTGNNEAILQMSQELAEIFGLRSLEINPTPGNDELVFVINGKSHRGNELGSGISQFVILASNVLVKRPSYLLIDEPELSLHASLQLHLLTLLAKSAENGVIFATHSLGLARSASDQLLITSRDEGVGTSINFYQAEPSISSKLGELGYGGLHDTAFQAVLLVEGASDVRTFQQLLSKYDVRNQVVIVPLGGDGLASGDRGQELAELARLSENVFAIVDSERIGEEDPPAARREAFGKNCEEQGIKCHILERRAIENYLSQEEARKVLRVPTASQFDFYSKPDAAWNWAKERNWLIAMGTGKPEIESSDLGVALREIHDSLNL